MVDDSLIRGLTSATLAKMALEAGAKAVYFAVTAPKYVNPCFYGLATKNKAKLIARDKSHQEFLNALGNNIKQVIFLEIERLRKILGPGCYACFDGKYPVPIE